jgi:hypothetical protein
MERKRLYLRTGDRVLHIHYPQWGLGEVMEEWRSSVPGGFCFVKVAFQDGRLRIFDNDFDSVYCCYYAGIRLLDK